MAGHVVIGALTGLVLLAAHILVTGDPRTALAVWVIGGIAGALSSALWSSLAGDAKSPAADRRGSHSFSRAVRLSGAEARARPVPTPAARRPREAAHPAFRDQR